MTSTQISIQFFLQLACILLVCRVVGLIAKRLGQPQVVAEMIAGVLMGPSLFGALAPGWQKMLFPASTMSVIYTFSQVGLVLYMFLVGLEFDTQLIRKQVSKAASVSLMGILMPFVLGAVFVLVYLVHQPGLFSAKIATWQVVLFMGAAISITAFPMLARIIVERGMAGTMMGTLALASGSMDDAAAWSVLAILLAVLSNNSTIAILAIGGAVAYALFMLFIGRPLLKPLGALAERDHGINGSILALVLVLLLACAWFTDTIGIYAIFGAFILGAVMPRGVFAYHLRKMLEPVVVNGLLPLFFVYSGLNTRLNLVNTPKLWLITGLIFLIAFVGKGVACWLAARLMRVPNREAMAIGSLMNARGLMELILLNVCLQRGIITPTLFTMLVLMAVVTTLMASPLFEFVYGRLRAKNSVDISVATAPVASRMLEQAAS
jgi:Kef-type K+ transport system membrane component KefB